MLVFRREISPGPNHDMDLTTVGHRKDGFEETQKLAQYGKSRFRITCINMEWKSKLIP